MKRNETVTQLDCGTFGPYRVSFGGGRSPEPVEWQIVPVTHALMGFVLPVALEQAGLLEQQPGRPLAELAAEKWGGSTDRLFADLERCGISPRSVKARALGVKRVIIGWSCPENQQKPEGEIRFCRSIEVTLAVLSRCVNQIYFQNREPDFSWNALFGQSLVVDEDLQEWGAAQ